VAIRKVTIDEKARVMTLEVDLDTPAPSASGKTLVVASTHGNQVTQVQIDGKPVIVGLNCYIRR
jgi:hypothetical protein